MTRTEEEIRQWLCNIGALPHGTSLAKAISLVDKQLQQAAKPVQLVLHCPCCKAQHIDDYFDAAHTTHHCAGCSTSWSPSAKPTLGIPSAPRTALDNWPICDPQRFAANATRDQYGHFWHPALPDIPGETPIEPYLNQIGWQCHFSDMESECTGEQLDDYYHSGDCSDWQPERPGPGWTLVSIYDTEDGPWCLLVRPYTPADRLGPTCTPVPFDLDKAAAAAQKRVAQFVEQRGNHHKVTMANIARACREVA